MILKIFLLAFIFTVLLIKPVSLPACYSTHGLTAQQKQEIVDAHNLLRAKVANGNELNQPSASNMKQIYWDAELETFSQTYTDTCPTVHNPNRNTQTYGVVGENIYWIWGGALNVTAAVVAWYNEVSVFSSNNINPQVFDANTGHYTQVVWAETSKVGCGAVYEQSSSKQTFLCNQASAGNQIGSPMYISGNACNNCPNNCSLTWPGLCDSNCNVKNCQTYSPGCACSACKPGFQLSAGICSNCTVANCSSYSSGCTCAACNAGTQLSNGICSICGNSNCIEYSTGCTCNVCKNGYSLVQGECAPCNILNCTNYSSSCNCNACEIGFYLNNTSTPPSCPACNAVNCTGYSSGCMCNSCIDGNKLINGTCQSCKIDNCSAYSNTSCSCTSCSTGFMKVSGLCQACNIYQCTGYSSGCTCSSCINGFQIANGICTSIECNVTQCSNYSAGCICNSCIRGYKMLSGQCTPCNVEQCNEQSSVCTCSSCNAGFNLTNGICSFCNLSQCSNYSSGCTCNKCNTGFEINEGVCQACNISKCTGFSVGCTCNLCSAGFYNIDGGCKACVVPQCSEYSKGCICSACEIGYSLVNSACVSGSNVSNTTVVHKCDAGYYQNFELGQCVKINCVDNCLYCLNNDTSCSSCLPGFILENGKCRAPYCLDGCGLCLKDNVCLSCIPGYYLVISNNSTETTKCLKCSGNCASCLPNSPAVCIDCLPGTFLKTSSSINVNDLFNLNLNLSFNLNLSSSISGGVCEKIENSSTLINILGTVNVNTFLQNITVTNAIAKELEGILTTNFSANSTSKNMIPQLSNFLDAQNNMLINVKTGVEILNTVVKTQDSLKVMCGAGKVDDANIAKQQKNCTNILSQIKAADFTDKSQVKAVFPFINDAAKIINLGTDVKTDLLNSYEEQKKALWNLNSINQAALNEVGRLEEISAEIKMKIAKPTAKATGNGVSLTTTLNNNFNLIINIDSSIKLPDDLLMEMVEIDQTVAQGILPKLPTPIKNSGLSFNFKILDISQINSKYEKFTDKNLQLNASITFVLPKGIFNTGQKNRCFYYEKGSSTNAWSMLEAPPTIQESATGTTVNCISNHFTYFTIGEETSNSSVWVYIGIALGIAIFIGIIIWGLCYFCKRKPISTPFNSVLELQSTKSIIFSGQIQQQQSAKIGIFDDVPPGMTATPAISQNVMKIDCGDVNDEEGAINAPNMFASHRVG